jgi:hypothetical protein
MFYFNLDNGAINLDQVGIDLPDLAAARAEAVSTLADRLCDSNVSSLLRGKPWRLWVTNQPGGKGITLFDVQITATDGVS